MLKTSMCKDLCTTGLWHIPQWNLVFDTEGEVCVSATHSAVGVNSQ